MNNPILILMGPAASGKSTIANKLLEDYAYHRIVTYTTRKPRYNEDENSYHFVSEDLFRQMINNGEFYEYDYFNGFYYGTKKEVFPYPSVLILTPKGYYNLSDSFTSIPIYLEVEKDRQMKYLLERGMDEEQIQKRIKEDENQKDWLDDKVKFYKNNKELNIVVSEINQYFKRGYFD